MQLPVTSAPAGLHCKTLFCASCDVDLREVSVSWRPGALGKKSYETGDMESNHGREGEEHPLRD